MLGKNYNLFWFPDCSNDKNERSGPFAWLAFVFLHPLTLYREAFCLLYMHELMGSLLLLSDEILLCLIQESGFLALLEQVLLLMWLLFNQER